MRLDQLNPPLAEALAMVASASLSAAEPWWIIGSAAAALHGVSLSAADVDLLLAPDDAKRLLQQMKITPATDGGEDRFRSEVFGRWEQGPIPIDVMGGFHVLREGHFVEVRPKTREAIELGGGTVFVPSAAELSKIMRLFGRPKDLARAKLLDDPLEG